MGIDGGGGDIGMTEQDLDDADIDAVLDQPRRIAMPQCVGRQPSWVRQRHRDGGSKGAAEHASMDRCVPGMVGEKPAAVAVGPPKAGQLIEERPWQWYQPLFVSLADHAQHLVRAVDVADLEPDRFADTQTTAIHQRKAGLVDRVVDCPEQGANLLVRQRFGQPFLPWGRDPFFSQTTPRPDQVYDSKGTVDQIERS